MTIEEQIKEWLFSQGMWENQAAAIVEIMKADDANKAMAGRWGEDYPDALFPALLPSVKQAALDYIDANCPQTHLRHLFTRH